MKKSVIVLLLLMLVLPQGVSAQEGRRSLGEKDIARVQACKRLFKGVDGQTMEETVEQLESNPYPREQIILMEAMARTYAEVVEEQEVSEPAKKKWLYSMVTLNMAYLQLGGYQLKKAHAVPLHRIIQGKLKKYIPPELMENRDLFNPLEF